MSCACIQIQHSDQSLHPVQLYSDYEYNLRPSSSVQSSSNSNKSLTPTGNIQLIIYTMFNGINKDDSAMNDTSAFISCNYLQAYYVYD